MKVYLADGRRAYNAGSGIYLTESPRATRDVIRTALICGAVTAAATAILILAHDARRLKKKLDEEE